MYALPGQVVCMYGVSEHVRRRDRRSARRVAAVTEHLHVRHYCTTVHKVIIIA